MGFKGVFIARTCFPDDESALLPTQLPCLVNLLLPIAVGANALSLLLKKNDNLKWKSSSMVYTTCGQSLTSSVNYAAHFWSILRGFHYMV